MMRTFRIQTALLALAIAGSFLLSGCGASGSSEPAKVVGKPVVVTIDKPEGTVRRNQELHIELPAKSAAQRLKVSGVNEATLHLVDDQFVSGALLNPPSDVGLSRFTFLGVSPGVLELSFLEANPEPNAEPVAVTITVVE